MEWNDETIAELRVLWTEGHSTAEIGRRLNVSKNAVVGKAHRLDLPARPSPIRRDGPRAPRCSVPRRVTGPTLPPLTTVAALLPEPQRPPAMPSPPARQPESAPVAIAKPAAPRAAPAYTVRPVPCCWPIGEPGTKGFHFCEATSVPGKPYCLEHAQIAYVKVRDRREEAA